MKNLLLGLHRLAILLVAWSVNAVDLTLAQNANRLPEPFINVSQQAGINATHRGEWDQFKPNFTHGYLGIGQAWGDYDNDDWLDLYVTGNMDDNVLYHNNADGTFSYQDDVKGGGTGKWSTKDSQFCETFGAGAPTDCGDFKTTGDAYFAAKSRLVEMKV